jgi:hypothetical protein
MTFDSSPSASVRKVMFPALPAVLRQRAGLRGGGFDLLAAKMKRAGASQVPPVSVGTHHGRLAHRVGLSLV